jgi:hypothetical protein
MLKGLCLVNLDYIIMIALHMIQHPHISNIFILANISHYKW